MRAEDFTDWFGAIENANAFEDEVRKMEKAYGEIFSSQLESGTIKCPFRRFYGSFYEDILSF